MIEQLKTMKDSLVGCVSNQINGNLEKVEAKELGEAIDMIKDLSEAIYYCTITDAMESKDKEEEWSRNYYSRKVMTPYDYMDDGRPTSGTMYYSDNRGGRSSSLRPSSYDYPMISAAHDPREGRSPMYRKMYMDGKMMHDKAKSMQELDNYMQELSSDLTEMIMDASPEEKQMLQQKITNLANKIK